MIAELYILPIAYVFDTCPRAEGTWWRLFQTDLDRDGFFKHGGQSKNDLSKKRSTSPGALSLTTGTLRVRCIIRDLTLQRFFRQFHPEYLLPEASVFSDTRVILP